MKPTPAQTRQRILELMEAACAATATSNPIVIGAVRTLICDVELPRLVPDRPTLEQVEAATQRE